MAKKKKGSSQGTAALKVLSQKKIPFELHSYEHSKDTASFGSEAAAALGRSENHVFKTLLIHHENNYAVCLIPVSRKLNLKHAAAVLGWKNARLADPAVAQRRTGYVVGGISPLGQKIPHPTLVDESARQLATILVSGGRRGLNIELAPADLLSLTGGRYAAMTAP